MRRVMFGAVGLLIGLACSGLPSGDGGETAERIGRLPDGGSSAWDEAVQAILVDSYDSNFTGLIDTPREVDSISCDVWFAMDAGVRSKYSTGMFNVYGFHGNGSFLGYAIGIATEMRHDAAMKFSSCTGVAYGGDQAASAGGENSDLARMISRIPDGGSSEWDAAVRVMLVGEYDRSGNEKIDTSAELAAITCDVWVAMDTGVKQKYSTGLYVVYGFSPGNSWDTDSYLGYTLGIVKDLAAEAGVAMARCGLVQ